GDDSLNHDVTTSAEALTVPAARDQSEAASQAIASTLPAGSPSSTGRQSPATTSEEGTTPSAATDGAIELPEGVLVPPHSATGSHDDRNPHEQSTAEGEPSPTVLDHPRSEE